MVLMAMTPDYARGYENGKQESAARIRELEADVARKDAALAAVDIILTEFTELKLPPPRQFMYMNEVGRLRLWMLCPQEAIEKTHDARALIVTALTE